MKWNSKAKAMVERMIEREQAHFEQCKEGTDEYNDSQKRLIALGERLAELEKTDLESKDQFKKFILETVKVGFGIVVPFACFVVAIAQEREINFTGAARTVVNSLLPGGKKLF